MFTKYLFYPDSLGIERYKRVVDVPAIICWNRKGAYGYGCLLYLQNHRNML